MISMYASFIIDQYNSNHGTESKKSGITYHVTLGVLFPRHTRQVLNAGLSEDGDQDGGMRDV